MQGLRGSSVALVHCSRVCCSTLIAIFDTFMCAAGCHRENMLLIDELGKPEPNTEDLQFPPRYWQNFKAQCMACQMNNNVDAADPGVVEVGVLGEPGGVDGVRAHVLAAGRPDGADPRAGADGPDGAGVPRELPRPPGPLLQPRHLPAPRHHRPLRLPLLPLHQAPQVPEEVAGAQIKIDACKLQSKLRATAVVTPQSIHWSSLPRRAWSSVTASHRSGPRPTGLRADEPRATTGDVGGRWIPHRQASTVNREQVESAGLSGGLRRVEEEERVALEAAGSGSHESGSGGPWPDPGVGNEMRGRHCVEVGAAESEANACMRWRLRGTARRRDGDTRPRGVAVVE